MTEMLYMKDVESNYIKEFDAKVIERGFDYVVLDRTAFYPLGGGQPSDTGWLEWPGGKAEVREVTKKEGVKHHLVQNPDIVPELVYGAINWERRYAHMRMHTAQHIVSGVVYDLYKARTVGNQLYHDRSRIDFAPVKFTDEMISDVERKCNEILASGAKVEICTTSRIELEKEVDVQRASLDLLPKSVQELRVVRIEQYDVCPCAGTHVRSLSELGNVKITKRENKGKDRERITYELV
ncbi:MAG: alanyl-tRNA editing protein [Thermoplasmatota archaeon]|nr:alanyl-tRNA editing protein [Candidatus Thermoplasmatota archaeon]MBU1914466.1 alanyl-tRNA editing protein [Candidatus Thermoplasmatota archaeon]